jgi:predicted PhzF superfamily epimerase YddE/YHI9
VPVLVGGLAAAVAAVAVWFASANDRDLAGEYRDILAVANGSYFEAHHLEAPGGESVGYVYGYEGRTSWVLGVLYDVPDGRYRLVAAGPGGESAEVATINVEGGHGTAGGALPGAYDNVTEVRLLGPQGPKLTVVRVFTTAAGEHGNHLGVFLAGGEVRLDDRQGVARDLGFAETVFVDDAESAEIRILTPELELPFAGHPSVGTAWLLRERVGEIAVLRPPAGDLRVHYERDLAWIAARPEWSPPFEFPQFGSAGEIDALDGAPPGVGWAYCWAWEDEAAGRVRARSFVPEAGIPEDEATGSAALALSALVDRPVEVRQGRGSEIFARPAGMGFVEVGGRVVLDEVRDYTVESR